MQYKQLQEKYPETLVLQLAGNFYRAYGVSAKVLAQLTGYKLSSSKEYKYRCGFPADNGTVKKVIDILTRVGINHKLFNKDNVVHSYDAKENKYKEISEHDIKSENVKEEEIKQIRKIGVSTIRASGISIEDAMGEIKRQINELFVNKRREITACTMIPVTNKNGEQEIYALIIYKE